MPRKADAIPGGGGGGAWKGGPHTPSSAKYGRKPPELSTNLTFARGRRSALDPVSAEILNTTQSGTSIFDPVLCELAYRWFCPPNGLVLDPFAGGSVRGIVASKLGRRYLGVDLRPEQVEANEAQARAICDANQPQWRVGDANNLDEVVGPMLFDFVLSCPPYGDLERYSDDPRDLSTMGHEEFLDAYRQIIDASLRKLKPDRFACFVVGDFRDEKGCYRNFPGVTVQAFEAGGARLYNEAILVTAVGSLPIRVAAAFERGRKLGKTHQNVLVFVKGDPVAATKAIGPVEFGDPMAAAEQTDAATAPAQAPAAAPNS
jgi:hypothetical protein